MQEKILEYLNNQGVSDAKFCEIMEWNRNKLNDIKRRKSKFSIEDIMIISEKFHTSTDYLLTGQNPLPKDLTQEQIEWLDLIDKLDPIKQAEFKGELKGYIKAKEENK